MKQRTILSTLLFCALLLAGCGTAAQTPDATPTPAQEAAATPTPTPDPLSTLPAPKPAHPNPTLAGIASLAGRCGRGGQGVLALSRWCNHGHPLAQGR